MFFPQSSRVLWPLTQAVQVSCYLLTKRHYISHIIKHEAISARSFLWAAMVATMVASAKTSQKANLDWPVQI